MYTCSHVDIYSCLWSWILDVLIISNYCWHYDSQLFQMLVYTHSWISCFLGVISSCCHFSPISICVGLHSLVFLLVKTTSVKSTLSNKSVVESTWLGVNWSGKLRTEWSLSSELVDKWLLFISNSLKWNRDDLNLVDRQIISSRQRMLARSIWVCLQGEGDVYSFLPLTLNPSYVMLDGMGLCCGMCYLKEWRRCLLLGV